jgi:[acyl-carrier-protein] S-malonyltransferase
MKAILFPGQGSQIVGMGSEFYNKFASVKKIFREADEVLNFEISRIILKGPESELKLTRNTQPSILLVSYVIFSVLKNEFNFDLKKVKYFAGHSLGEYSALLCANAINFKDALLLIFERGKSMQEAVPVGQGSMLAVLGTKMKDVNNYISELKNKNVCEVANDNAEGQIIVSGNTEAVEELKDILKKNKKKSILLPVSAPFHCSLMNPAANKMKEKIDNTNFRQPDFEIISNVTSLPTNNPENIKNLLVQQICSKVRWRESMLLINNKKVDDFIEIGPGKVLTGLIKRILPNSNSFSINSTDDIKTLINES